MCDNLVKIYKVADLEVVALQGLDLLIELGEFVALIGASGSGKSTLLNILGGLDVPSAGRAVVAGYQLDQLGTAEQTRYLRQVIGFVWQQTARNLLPYLTALENVALPMILDGVSDHARMSRARELLREVDLADRADFRPDRLSGGEQQRVAIAVALANGPDVILADEPTGQLDTATGHQIFELFRRLNRDLGVTIVVATHDPLVSEQVARTVAIRDGRVSSETLRQRSVTGEGDHHVDQHRIRRAGPGGPAAAAAGACRGAGAGEPGPSRARGRPRRGVAGCARGAAGSDLPRRCRSGPRHRRRPSHPRSRRASPDARVPSRAPAPPAPAPAPTWERPDPALAPARPRRPMTGAPPMVLATGLCRDFQNGSDVVHAVADVDLRVERGELVAVRGRSGSGKTTLLSLIGGLDRPTSGDLAIDGASLVGMGQADLVEMRRRRVGFIFQAFGLLSILSAAENVEVPLRLVSADVREREERVASLLDVVGLADRARHRPHELSGGEQQRVAIARALANRPDLLLADEPTGQLDSGHGPLDHDPAPDHRPPRGRHRPHRHPRPDAHRPRRPRRRTQGRARRRVVAFFGPADEPVSARYEPYSCYAKPGLLTATIGDHADAIPSSMRA